MPTEDRTPVYSSGQAKVSAICAECGEAFHCFPSAVRKFCSMPCYYKHKRGRPKGYAEGESRTSVLGKRQRNPYTPGRFTRACPQCKAEFSSFASQPRKFCSMACATKYRVENKVAYKPRRGVERQCDHCGGRMYVTQSKRDEKRFCSRACKVAGTMTAEAKTCPRCGAEFTAAPSRNQKYCSRDCNTAARIKRPLDRMHNGKPAILNAAGYIMVWEPDHPNPTFKGWQLEHRLVMERHIGRYLAPEEVVHHRDGCKTRNDIDNLEIMDAVDHATLSARDYRDSLAKELGEAEAVREKLAEYERRFGPLT